MKATPGGPVISDTTPTAPIPVAVVASDPLTAQGTVSFLRTRPEVTVLDAQRRHEAEVALIIVDTITEETLKIMAGFSSTSPLGGTRFVLIGDGMREHHVARAVNHGLASVISRHEADFGQILRTVMDVHAGRLEMPGDAVGWLTGQLRRLQQDVLEPKGLAATPAGMSKREVEVLSLLADGMSTAEIARRLNYSERTIKNTIHTMMARLGLRNRAHAVAFAMRHNAF